MPTFFPGTFQKASRSQVLASTEFHPTSIKLLACAGYLFDGVTDGGISPGSLQANGRTDTFMYQVEGELPGGWGC